MYVKKQIKKTNGESDVYEVRKQQNNQLKNNVRRTINHGMNCISIISLFNMKNMVLNLVHVVNTLNRKARKRTPGVISIDKHLCTSKLKIADEFNNY